ncbi:unnamed protein product, partial [marine sediment metagenome]
DDTAAQIEKNREINGRQSKPFAHRSYVGKQESHYNSSKNLEESFYPKVNNPPPPVFGIGGGSPLANGIRSCA